MYPERDTVITRLRREMKESPLPAPVPQKPERTILADGYERQTNEEPLQITKKYRQRVPRLIVRWLIIAIFFSLLVVAIIQTKLIVI